MTDNERDARDFVQLKLRCRESLRARIEEQAAEHGCSLNAEAVRRLEQSFEHEDIIERLQTALRIERRDYLLGKIESGQSAGEALESYRAEIAELRARLAKLETGGTQSIQDVVKQAVAEGVAQALREEREVRTDGFPVDVQHVELREAPKKRSKSAA